MNSNLLKYIKRQESVQLLGLVGGKVLLLYIIYCYILVEILFNVIKPLCLLTGVYES